VSPFIRGLVSRTDCEYIIHIYGFTDMGTHMKTTIDISDVLFQQAKRLASERKTTLRAILESALRNYLSDEKRPGQKTIRLRKHTFRGKGIQRGLEEENWAEIRKRAYEGRGG
jgi:Uncharacterized protein conserved in bacteria (DUF2191).